MCKATIYASEKTSAPDSDSRCELPKVSNRKSAQTSVSNGHVVMASWSSFDWSFLTGHFWLVISDWSFLTGHFWLVIFHREEMCVLMSVNRRRLVVSKTLTLGFSWTQTCNECQTLHDDSTCWVFSCAHHFQLTFTLLLRSQQRDTEILIYGWV